MLLTKHLLQNLWNKAIINTSNHNYFDYFEEEYIKDFKLEKFSDLQMDEELDYLSENEVSWQAQE